MALQEADWAAQYTLLLGVDSQNERVLFNAIAAVILRGLPEGWTLQVDSKQRAYFWNSLNGESLWAHPDHEIFTAIIELYRMAGQQPNPGYFLRHVLHQLEQQSLSEGNNWSGPYFTAQGDRYWHDANTGISSWQDPRAEISRRHVVRSGLVLALLADVEQRPRPPPVPRMLQAFDQDLKVQSLPPSPSNQMPPRPPSPFSGVGGFDQAQGPREERGGLAAAAAWAPSPERQAPPPQQAAAPRPGEGARHGFADRVASSRHSRAPQVASPAALAEEAVPMGRVQPFPGLWPKAQLEASLPADPPRQPMPARQLRQAHQAAAGAHAQAEAQSSAQGGAAAASRSRTGLARTAGPSLPALQEEHDEQLDFAEPEELATQEGPEDPPVERKLEAMLDDEVLLASPAGSPEPEASVVPAVTIGREPPKALPAATESAASSEQPARQATPPGLGKEGGAAASGLSTPTTVAPSEEPPAAETPTPPLSPLSPGHPARQAPPSRLRGPAGPAAPRVEPSLAVAPSEAVARQAELRKQRRLERLQRSFSARRIQRAWKAHRRAQEDQVRREQAQIAEQVSQWRNQRTEAARTIQTWWRHLTSRRRFRRAVMELLRRSRKARLEAARAKAAIDIQRWWRGVESRKMTALLKVELRAKKRRASLAKQRAQAAVVLQCAWRCRAARLKRQALAAERARAAQQAALQAAQLAEAAALQAEVAPPAPMLAQAESPPAPATPPAPFEEPAEPEAEDDVAKQALRSILEESGHLPEKRAPSPKTTVLELQRRVSKPAALEITTESSPVSPVRDKDSTLWWQWGEPGPKEHVDATGSPTNAAKKKVRRRRSTESRPCDQLKSCSEVSSLESSAATGFSSGTSYSPAGSSTPSTFKRSIPLYAEDDILTKHLNSSGSITRGTTSTRSTAMGSTRVGFESVASGSDIGSFANLPESPCHLTQASPTPLAYRPPGHGLNPALINAGHQLTTSRSQPVLSNGRMLLGSDLPPTTLAGAAANSRKSLGQGSVLPARPRAEPTASRAWVPGH